ncbi:MAG: PAS domain S-box protein [Rivularia sp. (in: cyanobacteria)]
MLPAEFKSLQPLNENTVNSLPMCQLAMDNLPELIYWKNNDLVFQGCNLAFAKAVGLTSPQQIVGKTDSELPLKNQMLGFLRNRVQSGSFRSDRQIIEDNTNFEQIRISNLASGEKVWLDIRKNPLVNSDGEVVGMLCRIEDITKRKLEEAELIESGQRRLALMVQQSPLAVIEWNRNFEIKEWNQAAERIFGYSKSEVLGRDFSFLVTDDFKIRLEEMLQNFVIDRQRMFSTNENVTKDGRKIVCEWYNYPLVAANGEVVGIASMAFEITERRQAEIALQSSLKESADIKFALNQAAIVAITDEGGNIEYVNDNFCEISKYTREELIGKNHSIVNSKNHPKSFFTQMWETISSGKVWRGEIQNCAKDGSLYWVDTTIVPMLNEEGKPQHYIAIRNDITARKQAETEVHQKAQDLENTISELQRAQTQLVQSEKMSGLGQLVAGVAHEINNPVNFIYGNLNHANNYIQDLLEIIETYGRNYPQPTLEIQELTEEKDLEFLVEDLPKLLGSMKVGAQRIREIVASLRNFSRMDEAQMKEVDIHEGIDSTLMILEHRIKAKHDRSRIEIIKYYSKLPQIECYPGQLNQVFMNILANALDALEEGIKDNNSPTICIRTELVGCKQVKISISDNGKGIPEKIKTRLFDPFFTTKPVGKGTGMGLSISYQIVVEKHCGSLECVSAPGKGTEFVITIPLKQCICK